MLYWGRRRGQGLGSQSPLETYCGCLELVQPDKKLESVNKHEKNKNTLTTYIGNAGEATSLVDSDMTGGSNF